MDYLYYLYSLSLFLSLCICIYTYYDIFYYMLIYNFHLCIRRTNVWGRRHEAIATKSAALAEWRAKRGTANS